MEYEKNFSPGMVVKVRPTPDSHEEQIGIILNVKAGAVDALCFTKFGMVYRRDLWNESDERVERSAPLFTDPAFSDRGIFRVIGVIGAPSELGNLISRLNSLEEAYDRLEKELADIQSRLRSLADTIQVLRSAEVEPQRRVMRRVPVDRTTD